MDSTLVPRFGDCLCDCHDTAGIDHLFPCCSPVDEEGRYGNCVVCEGPMDYEPHTYHFPDCPQDEMCDCGPMECHPECCPTCAE